MKKAIFLLLFIFGSVCSVGQDLRGAFIQTKKISNYTYSISLILYTEPSLSIARPTASINFGDGLSANFGLVTTSNVSGVNIKTYTGTHTFAGPGNYNINFIDNYRIAGIKNMSNSDAQPMHVSSLLIITALLGPNTSPSIGFEPMDAGISGNLMVYNPAFSDTDSDSLSYALKAFPVANHYVPGTATVTTSGLLSFPKDSVGLYCFILEIKEWRKNTSGSYQVISVSNFDLIIDNTIAVGTHEASNLISYMKVYPNPTLEYLTLSNETNLNDYTIEVVNNQGKIVLKTNFTQNIFLGSLSKGVYTLVISRDGRVCENVKVVKE